MPPPAPPSERSALFAIGAVQFVNILDFMMVMPMGPDFARALDIPLSHIGYIGGSYTAAAAVSGLAGSFFLERFDRKKALLVSLAGLVIGTAMGGFATGMWTLLAARMVAGAFGGPATSLSMSMVADLVPPERRGRAVGAVMSAFSVASVLGVPAGLVLALGGWRFPFFAVAALGAGVFLLAAKLLPSLAHARHGAQQSEAAQWRSLLSQRSVWLSWVMTAVVMMAGFVLIPNISSYTQENLHFPRVGLPILYLCGGLVSFFVMRAGGKLVDRFGSFLTGTAGAVLMIGLVYAGFVNAEWIMPPNLHWLRPLQRYFDLILWVPIVLLFTAFMAINALRNVAYNTLTSKVPASNERARFMSIQSAVQHIASAAGAFLSARLLWERADGSLGGVPGIAWLSIGMTAAIPVMLFVVEARIARPDLRAKTGMQPHDLQSGVTAAGPGMPRPPPPKE